MWAMKHSPPQGSTINLAGCTLLPKAKFEFIRFSREGEGEVDRRVFCYNHKVASISWKRLVLMGRDIVRVSDSALSAGIGLLNEAVTAFVAVYGLYSTGLG